MQLNHGRGQRNFKGNGEFLRLIKKRIEKKATGYRHARTIRCRKNDKVSSR